MSGEVHPLKGEQAQAVDPRDSVWLSASAGTGKTQVLSARVLRLLLREDVEPGQILCLTFTKAGAAEMATRVNEVLANWVRMPDTDLARDLIAIGESPSADVIARARSSFAQVLDCPGGGLRIDTIHAFSQWLLAAFPEEAGLIPAPSRWRTATATFSRTACLPACWSNGRNGARPRCSPRSKCSASAWAPTRRAPG